MRKLLLVLIFILLICFLFYPDEYRRITITIMDDLDIYILNNIINKITKLNLKEFHSTHYKNNKKQISELIIKFDNKGNIIERSIVNNEIKKPLKFLFNYDDKNVLISTKIYNKKDKLLSVENYIYKYNQEGLALEIKKEYGNPKILKNNFQLYEIDYIY